MCGIAGIVQTDEAAVEGRLLEAMTASLAHRGPDGAGYLLASSHDGEKPLTAAGRLCESIGERHGRYNIGLGHRRLAIIDRTPLGHQPMGTADGRFWITYNGEVYNAPELRRELAGQGVEFRSTCDTEVVLEAYRCWGKDCLHRFNGMFAFAVWDGRERQLFCARDRYGIKPFYYRVAEGRFLFASEIKALRCDPTYRTRPNDHALYDYLTAALIDHTDQTCFDGVNQLRPGERLTVRFGQGARQAGSASVLRERWYDLPHEEHDLDGEQAAAALRELLQDCVRLELRSDVPIGSCLSGGLDSSSIVCLMSRLLPRTAPRPATFSACYEDPRCDERGFIQAVVSETRAANRAVFPDPGRLYGQLPAVLRHQEEPFAGTSILAQWAVMEAAGEAGVRVLLDGQGADELLLGYPGYLGSRLADLARSGRWVEAYRECRAWGALHGGLPATVTANLVRGLLPEAAAEALRARMTGERSWLNPEFVRSVKPLGALAPRDVELDGTALRRHQQRSLRRDLPALLHYEDRNAMAHSIEARVPFLDHRLVEWALRLPPELKLFRGTTKWILREAMQGILPESVRRRRDKMGFVTPQDHWLRDCWRPHIEALLKTDSLKRRPYWRADVLREQYRQYCAGRPAIGPTVWRWVNLELWLQAICD